MGGYLDKFLPNTLLSSTGIITDSMSKPTTLTCITNYQPKQHQQKSKHLFNYLRKGKSLKETYKSALETGRKKIAMSINATLKWIAPKHNVNAIIAFIVLRDSANSSFPRKTFFMFLFFLSLRWWRKMLGLWKGAES